MRKLKFLLSAICMTFLCSINALAMAAGSIALDHAYIGGIGPGTKLIDIYNGYGKFNTVYPKGRDSSVTWGYGKTIKVCFWGDYWQNGEVKGINPNNTLRDLEVTANNGMQTPDGIAVGMTVNDLLNTYGEPARIAKVQNGIENYLYACGKNATMRFGIKYSKIVTMGIHVTD